MEHHEWLDHGAFPHAKAVELAGWAAELRASAAETVAESRRLRERLHEANRARSRRRAREVGEDREVGVQPDVIQTPHVKR